MEHDLTICHVSLPGESFSWAGALEAAETTWRHVSENGLFLTLLTSGKREDRDAMLGIAFRKEDVPSASLSGPQQLPELAEEGPKVITSSPSPTKVNITLKKKETPGEKQK